jgi:hypothetical protein
VSSGLEVETLADTVTVRAHRVAACPTETGSPWRDA